MWPVKRFVVLGAALMLLVFAFFGYLWLAFYLGDDLVIDLAANQTSFRIANNEETQVKVDLTAEGQLFCRTDCRLALLDANSRNIRLEEFQLEDNITKEFTLRATGVGTGQSLYTLVASCHNVRSTMCPSLEPERRKTVLLTVNYNLAETEAEAKSLLEPRLLELLAIVREADLVMAEVAQLIAENPRLKADTLSVDLARVQDDLSAQKIALENARTRWSQAQYLQVYEDFGNTTNQSALLVFGNATVLRENLFALAQQHNDLRAEVEVTRETLIEVLARYPQLPYLENSARAIETVNALVIAYSTDTFASYDSLAEIIIAAQDNITHVNGSRNLRYATAVKEGVLLIELEHACANCTNITLIPDICVNISGVVNSTNATLAYNSTYCVLHEHDPVNTTPLPALTLKTVEAQSAVEVSLPQFAPQCCVFGDCKACCSSAECRDDPSTYPVIFVHGHAFNSFNSPEYSLGGYFTKIQQRLQEDGYLDAGIITPSSSLSEVEPGEWGLSGRPVTARVTYYYNFYREDDEYVIVTQNSESIENYAVRLAELVNIVKHHTGKDKVNIVSHSMGGLVTRRYLQLFGEGSVNQVILIGTPNAGITARTRTLCPLFGESKECEDMEKGSVFMRKLNDPDHQPTVRIVTITGHGCLVGGSDGDGVIEASSVPLPYAVNHDINGTCTDFFGSELHTEMLNVDKYPAVYDLIKKELR